MNDLQNTPATTATIDEELVAYLDGELDASGAARIERRLADDAAYRARLAQLERAWDMLDTLQRSEANDDFARSTVEMIAIKAVDDAKTGQMRAVRQRRLVVLQGSEFSRPSPRAPGAIARLAAAFDSLSRSAGPVH